MYSYSLSFLSYAMFFFYLLHDSKMLYNELDIVKGIMLDRGYISNYFVTNAKRVEGEESQERRGRIIA